MVRRGTQLQKVFLIVYIIAECMHSALRPVYTTPVMRIQSGGGFNVH